MALPFTDLDVMVQRIRYAQPARVMHDIMDVWQHYSALRHMAKTHFHADGRESFLVVLDGTVPITYNGANYNIPIEVLLAENYPNEAPLCFVRPVAGMEVRRKHRHVSMDGRVNLPYLSAWRAHDHNLSTLLQHMVAVFSSDPPVFTKLVGNSSAKNINGGGVHAKRHSHNISP